MENVVVVFPKLDDGNKIKAVLVKMVLMLIMYVQVAHRHLSM